MPSRTCELYLIPTEFLKKVLVHCIPTITKVINLSLSTGDFSKEWKLAIVQSLIKTIKKGTEKSNYGPVSIMQFISKVIKNVHLTNSLITATNMTCYQNINLPIGNITVVRPVFSSWLMMLYGQWKTSLLQQSQSCIYLQPLTLLVMTFCSLYSENDLESRM